MFQVLWVLILAGLFVVSGCDRKPAERTPGKVTKEDVRRDAGQALNTASDFANQSKEEFQNKLDARLKELDTEMAALREKGRDLQGDAKADWERKMADLEKKRDAARAKLAEVGQSSAEAWKDVQQGAQSAWEDLDKAFHEASGEFDR